ncbi:MAG: hypothetical protein H8E55_68465 [Pelagibacterales bacterium]|nr:hypothetical protein [Pelagibacterales bacterium]
MKITSYIAVSILLFSFSSAANKSISETGNVQIEDLFYKSKIPLIPAEIDKIDIREVEDILEKDEDFELESLEIADIDLSTFGEYEEFLNKYYDDNYTAINSKFIKHFEFEFSTALGGRIPFGANTREFLKTGSDIGLFFSPTKTFNFLNNECKIYVEINKTFLNSKVSDEIIFNNSRYTLGSIINLTNNLFSRIGISLNITEGGFQSNPDIKRGFSTNVDLGYNLLKIKNLQIIAFARAQTMFNAVTNPPIDAGSNGSIETLSFGLQIGSPIYLVY